jgi:2-polyprenyl-3-methyl-5-hydroxy-6-metoxy-1,4-benzoquinol methylase
MSNYSDSKFDFGDPNTSWYKTFNLVPKNSLVLDVGCSSGAFGEQLISQKNCTVDGIEIDDGDIVKAKKKLREVYKIDIERDPINIDQKYDVVFFGDVIEHLAQPIRALEKIKKLLREDGVLIFSIPNITHMSVRLMLLSGKIEYGRTGLLDETHLHFYNSKEIYRVFNEAGYKIDSFDYTINDMPYDLVKKNLKELGLQAEESFKSLLRSVDAAAYQFIGVATKSKTKTKQSLPRSSPHNIVEGYIKEMKAQYEKAIADLADDRQKVVEDRGRVVLEKNRLQAELEKSGRYRKLAKRQLASAVKRINRQK